MSELEKIIGEKFEKKIVRTGIYKITSPTGRIYVGKSKDIRKRWMSYLNIRCKSQPKLYRSLVKYGPKAHKFEVLEECLYEQLDDREVHWGVKFRVLEKGNLNTVLGSAGVTKSHKRKIVKNLLSPQVTAKAIIQYSIDGSFIKEWGSIASAARHLNIGETGIQKCCKGHRCQYKNHIWRFKKDNKIEGFEIRTSKKVVIQMDLKGVFVKEWPSASDAARYFNADPNNISACCKKNQATAFGYTWRFKDIVIDKEPPPQQRRCVLQYSKEGEFIKEWESIRQACLSIPGCKNISRVLAGKGKSCGGYVWRYKD